jgi:hypothetical protein
LRARRAERAQDRRVEAPLVLRAAIAACSTSSPPSSVNRNTNSTARDTCSMIAAPGA